MKAWLAVAALLTLIVCAASATLRLSQAQVGCEPWPACQQQAVLADATSAASARATPAAPSGAAADTAPAWHEPVRLTHRTSATVAGLMYLLALLFGWSRWSGGQRAAGTGLLVISFGLAWLGRYTPSDKPAVVIGNLLGGHLLLALLALLIASLAAAARSGASRVSGRGSRFGAFGVLALIVIAQIALGALVSARAAGAACQHGCSLAALLTAAAVAFDPTVGLAALPTAAAHAIERQAVLTAHIALGVLLLALAVVAAWRARGHRSPAVLGAATAALGTTMAVAAYPLGLAVAHSLFAAATLCAAALAWHAARTPARRAG